ncbi:hypothetical protein BJV82DRAFT_630887 [Fennellomyces sp. T-0311]|nr:hypothetical protein BJV82DRAFT_630887 [Fennellomyces sp. T-0311]
MTDDYDIKQHLDITKSWTDNPTAYLTRYYTLHFHSEESDSNATLYARQAPNKVCIVGITDRHSVVVQQKPIKLEATLSSNANVKPETVLCELVTDDARYVIKAQMQGKLLELNPRVLENPQLLLDKPMTEGYLAVIKPQYEDTSRQLSRFTAQ